jgi:hypothetical protein
MAKKSFSFLQQIISKVVFKMVLKMVMESRNLRTEMYTKENTKITNFKEKVNFYIYLGIYEWQDGSIYEG